MIEFFLPYKVVGKKPPRVSTRGGHARAYKPARETDNTDALQALMLPHRPAEPMDGPLSLYLVVARPGRKKKDAWAPTKPDLDNCMKQVMDCAEKMGFVANDSRIVYVGMAKVLDVTHGCYIKITPATSYELECTMEAYGHGKKLLTGAAK